MRKLAYWKALYGGTPTLTASVRIESGQSFLLKDCHSLQIVKVSGTMCVSLMLFLSCDGCLYIKGGYIV